MNDNTDEIDLIELFKKIYLNKKFIFKTSIFAALFGLVFALFQPSEFTSSTTFIPQLNSGVKTGGSSLTGLASLAGINIGSMESSSEFPPTLYPQVVNGVPFRLELLSNEIKINNKVVLVRDYFLEKKSSFNIIGTIKKYTIGLPSLILSSFKDESEILNESIIYSVTQEDKALFELINNNLSLSINEKEGFITISFTDSNKNVAAQITQIAQNLLQEKIIEFKNMSSKEMLDFALVNSHSMLAQGCKGFFIMAEGSQIDWEGHDNDFYGQYDEIEEFENAIESALAFAKNRQDTLVLVTADHETGGLLIEKDTLRYKETNQMKVSWNTAIGKGDHTGAMVPIFAYGPGSANFTGILDNTDIFFAMQEAIGMDDLPDGTCY